ncbi:MAG: GAF domain-containing protein [Deltaproteobacteria bacterium]|nr:MAG: GAF domain-containing protein [Deltaproteobacteria bacterium]
MAAEQDTPVEIKKQIAENQQIIDRLNRELARKSNEVRIIQQISSEITSTLDLNRILEIILSAMDRILGFQHAMILLKDQAADRLRVVASRGYDHVTVGVEIAVGHGVIGVVAERKKMMRLGNIGASISYLTTVREKLKEAGQLDPSQSTAKLPGLPNVQSQLAMPLLVKDRLIGVLAVESPRPNAFDELDEILLSIVANQAATAIETAQMYQMVEQLSRLKRFFSPHLAELIVAGGTEDPLKTHRREVTVVFLDLRGFTTFAELVEPEEVMSVLRDYHAEMGRLILEHGGTLERFTGDGMMIFFNDPVPVPNPAEHALRMALAMRERVQELSTKWRRRGYDLALGIGIAQGYATIGAIGFEGRWDYGAIGTVTNLAARLCGEATGNQILASLRVVGEVEDLIETEEVGPLVLKGFHKPVSAFSVLGLKANALIDPQ